MKKITLITSIYLTSLFFACVNKKSTDNKPILNDEISAYKSDTLRNEKNEIEKVNIYFNNKLSRVNFYQNNRLKKVLNYFDRGDKIIPNEQYVLNSNGDTIINESLYHGVYCSNDTISSDEGYVFKVVLEGHLFDSAYLALSNNVNEDFPYDTIKSPVLEMKNFQGPVLTVKGNRKGWNYIKGRIDNVRNPQQLKGQPRMAIASLYFIDSFYVK